MLLITLSILLCSLAFFYSIVVLKLHRGLSCLKTGTHPLHPFVSIVVAARNEEKTIASCLKTLCNQRYPADKHEIIIVNDRSDDRTADIVNRFSEKYSRVRLINVDESESDMAPKKWALHRGIQASGGEIILTTDADCIVRPGWIASIVRYFEDDVGLVAGYSSIQNTSPSLFHKLMALDALALAGVAAGSFGAGFPLTCTGRNLAYRKATYTQVGGFRSIGRFLSGDDDLFLHTVRKNTDWKCRYAVDEASVIFSNPPQNVKAFIHQRIRHASKGRYYEKLLRNGLIAVYLFNVLLVISLLLPSLRSLFWVAFGLKSTVEFILVTKTAYLFKQRKLLWFFPGAMLLHVFYVVIFGFLGQVAKFQWKGGVFAPTLQTRSEHEGK